jgi:hypothetical protein
MSRHGAGRRPSIRKHVLILMAALMVPLGTLGFASPALATPKGPYAVFAQCPTEIPGVELCSFAQTTGGELAIGSTKVPINKTITLQGGGIRLKENTFALLPAKNGESLSKTELNVPGGLLDLVNCQEIKGNGFWEVIERVSCEAVFENKNSTGVTATTELVANASNPAILNLEAIFAQNAPALTLPVRVHLKNPLLGESCYIGSEAHPIQLHLTTGTTSPPLPNKPITGAPGSFSVEEGEIIVASGNTLVDNAFSVPTAEGCGGFFSFIIDPIVDAKLGLESAAGNNTAILSGTQKVTTAEAVIKSE